METLIMFEGDEPVDVSRENVNAAMERGLEPAAEFMTPENESVIVRQRNFDAAFSKGLKPKNAQEMGVWDAFKAGAKRGWDVFASTETGMEPEKTSLEQSQAWAESPVSYGAGVVAGMAPAALAGAGLGYGVVKGMQKGGQAAAPMVRPSALAAKQAYQETMASSDVPDFATVTKPAWSAIKGAAAAVKQVPETRREMADLAKLERRDVNREAGSVGSQGQRIYLGQELLEPGATPEKAAIAERAATIAPSNLRIDQLKKALEMGTTRRQQARNFLPEVAAEDVTPGLVGMQKSLKKGSGEAYAPLFEKASKEYQYEHGAGVPSTFKNLLSRSDQIEGVSGAAKQALKVAQQIVEIGPEEYSKRGIGTTELAWDSISSVDQYKRIKVAREVLNKTISDMKKTRDATILNEPSRMVLDAAKEKLDSVMKSFPSQRKADEAYSEAKRAMGGLFEAMEFGQGERKKIDVPTVKKLFGNNDKAYRIQEGIDTMRQFLSKFGDDIAPNKRQEMQSVVDKFDALRKQAEDKRLLEGLRQAEGPSSPAIERTSALREAKGLPSNIFTSPASALNAADEFMAARSRQFFGKPFEQLAQNDKNRMIRLLMWRQQNPNATMTDEESMFKKIGKGK
jgi:hypothetical protein